MTTRREEFVRALDYMSMCERAMQITSMGEPCFADRREELTTARAAVLQAYDEAAGREGEAVAIVSGQIGAECRVAWMRPENVSVGNLLYTHPAPKAVAAVPDGWVLVPREPTAHMCHEGHAVGYGYTKNAGYDYNGADHVQTIYRAMLAASPAPKTDEVSPYTDVGPTPMRGRVTRREE